MKVFPKSKVLSVVLVGLLLAILGPCVYQAISVALYLKPVNTTEVDRGTISLMVQTLSVDIPETANLIGFHEAKGVDYTFALKAEMTAADFARFFISTRIAETAVRRYFGEGSSDSHLPRSLVSIQRFQFEWWNPDSYPDLFRGDITNQTNQTFQQLSFTDRSRDTVTVFYVCGTY